MIKVLKKMLFVLLDKKHKMEKYSSLSIPNFKFKCHPILCFGLLKSIYALSSLTHSARDSCIQVQEMCE